MLVIAPAQAQDVNDTDNSTVAEVNVKSYTDLNNQVNNTLNNSTLTLDESYEYDSGTDEGLADGIVISKNLTIVGKNSSYIDGKCLARGLFIDSNCNVVLENLTFKNGFSAVNGGGIFLSSNSNLTVINCIFINNTVYNSNGGAIYAHMTTNVKVISSYFFNNTSIRESDLEWEEFKKGMGSAICQSIDSNLTLIESVFKNNKAYLSTILLVSYTNDTYKISTLSIRNCLLENNTSFSSGVVYLDELGRGEIIDTVFKSNNITDHSGVLVLDACFALVKNCLFDSNSAVNGGAMHIKLYEDTQANVFITNSNFTSNKVSQQGGVIYSNSGIITISDSNFYNNSCSGNGGAIIAKKGSISISNSEFINNSCSANGGALSLTNDYIYMNNVLFINNSASNSGGAVYSTTETVVSSNCTFINNSAAVCSDVYGAFSAFVTMSNSYFDDVEISVKINSLWNMTGSQDIKLKFTGTKTYTTHWLKTDSDGILNLKVPLALNTGAYALTITMATGTCYLKSTVIKVAQAPAKLKVSKLTTTYKSGKIFKIYVKNSKTGKYVKGAKLKLKVWTGKKSKTYTLTADKNGLVKFDTSNLSVGTHNIEIISSDTNIILSKVKTSVKINKATAKISYPSSVKKSSKITVTVKNKASGKAIKKNKFTVKVYTGKNSKTFKLKTNSKGIIKISTKGISKGSHKVTIVLKNSCYSISKKFNIKIK